jgi:hypothetical protein
MFVPEVAVGLCRIVLYTLKRYRALDLASRPRLVVLNLKQLSWHVTVKPAWPYSGSWHVAVSDVKHTMHGCAS